MAIPFQVDQSESSLLLWDCFPPDLCPSCSDTFRRGILGLVAAESLTSKVQEKEAERQRESRGGEEREGEGTDACQACDGSLLHLPSIIHKVFLFVHAGRTWLLPPRTLHGGVLLPSLLATEAGRVLKVPDLPRLQ